MGKRLAEPPAAAVCPSRVSIVAILVALWEAHFLVFISESQLVTLLGDERAVFTFWFIVVISSAT